MCSEIYEDKQKVFSFQFAFVLPYLMLIVICTYAYSKAYAACFRRFQSFVFILICASENQSL